MLFRSRFGQNDINGVNIFKTTNSTIDPNKIGNVGQSVYQIGTFNNNPSTLGLGTTLDYTELQDSGTNNVLNDKNDYNQVQNVQDFRQKRSKNKGVDSLDYGEFTNRIEGRVNLGNPGIRISGILICGGRKIF